MSWNYKIVDRRSERRLKIIYIFNLDITLLEPNIDPWIVQPGGPKRL